MDARRTAEDAARTSYGRLLALLVARSRDVAAAEDALSEAFLAALRTWPERGVPKNADAWLLTAARNTLIDQGRHAARRAGALPDLERHFAELAEMPERFPDERLKLTFVCAHPSIDPAIRAPLILQVVMGLDAVRIASAFLIAPATMGQRLVRAKSKIRDAGLRMAVPSPVDLTERLDDVLTAIYAAFGAAWDAVPGGNTDKGGLAEEAIFLGRMLASLLPDEPEVHGLLALMLHCHARRAARRDEVGAFVPLEQQDSALWDRDMIIEAEAALTHAASFARMGRYQCEASIQSVHCQRPITGVTNYAALRLLYKLLATHYPSIGALIGYAAVLARTGQPQAAIEMLDDLPASRTATYQPYWVTRAHALRELGRSSETETSIRTAIGLSQEPAIRHFLRASFLHDQSLTAA